MSQNILITGGTGSFGERFVNHSLKKNLYNKIVIYSRDEMKQWEMKNNYKDNRLDFIIGDIRDKNRLENSLHNIDYILHCAATKIVPTAEYNPVECIKTNILGAANLVEAVKNTSIKKVVALSTDKASNPINLYGASKLASDKLFIAANSDNLNNKFSVVRYGNVLNSRGSVVPFFNSIPKNKPIPITDKKMTRFLITFEIAIEQVKHAFKDMIGGEIYVKKLPSIKIMDLAKAIRPNSKIKLIGIRPGEKIHEQMISSDESMHTYEYNDYYKILPNLYNWNKDKKRIKKGKKVKDNFEYISSTNDEWLDSNQIKQWIKAYS